MQKSEMWPEKLLKVRIKNALENKKDCLHDSSIL